MGQETVREGPGDVACLTGPPGQQLLYVGTNDRGREVPVSRTGDGPGGARGRVRKVACFSIFLHLEILFCEKCDCIE